MCVLKRFLGGLWFCGRKTVDHGLLAHEQLKLDMFQMWDVLANVLAMDVYSFKNNFKDILYSF